MFMIRVQNAGRSHNMKTEYVSIENFEDFGYLGTKLTYQNSIQKVIKSRFSSGNVCYLSVQNLLSSSLLYKNLNIKIYINIIMPVCCVGVKLGLSH